jgi:hypothetical protein
MPHQKEIVAPGLVLIERKRVFFKSTLPSPKELQDYMDRIGVLNLEQLRILQDKITKRIKEAESSLFSRIMSSLWYYVKGQIKIDVVTLYWLMSNFDKVAGYMPNEFWKKVVLAIDKIGENLLAKEKESGKLG